MAMRIKEFMAKILADDVHCDNEKHKHEDVREATLLFKELNFGCKKWQVELPSNGFSTFMPMFNFKTSMI